MVDFKGHRIEKDIILTRVWWDLAYPLSYRNFERDDGGAGRAGLSFQYLPLSREGHAPIG